MSVPVGRIEMHKKAKEMLIHSQFESASGLLQEALDSHGAHIGLRLDLANCLFLLHSYPQWSILVSEIEKDVQGLKSLLKPKNYWHSLFLLSKFIEEQGRVSAALDNYKDLYVGTNDLDLKARALSQVVRLQAQHGFKTELSKNYTLLRGFDRKANTNTTLDILHALVLAEAELLSENEFMLTLAEYQKIPQQSEDQSLMHYDLLEIILRKGYAITGGIKNLFSDLHPKTDFEIYLLQVYLQQNVQLKNSFLEQMPLNHFLRLAACLSSRSAHSYNEELVRFSLSGLDSADQKLWSKIIKVKTNAIVNLKLCGSQITVNGHTSIDLGNQKSIVDLLSLFIENRKYSVVDICEQMWKTSYNTSYYFRLRRVCDRINAIAIQHSLPKLIQFSQGEIYLSENVILSK
ncbi:MAG: hypothetical protein ACOYOK_10830 [Pseudobdellovibrionaceae bacterium]